MVLGTSAAIFFGGVDKDALVFGNGISPPTPGYQEGFFFLDLPAGIYFDGILLEDPQPFWEDKSPLTSVTELLSGEVSVQSSTETFERPILVSFKCRSPIHHTITLLRKKEGRKCTLKIDEFVYENCYITKLKELEWANGLFSFIISFAQDTTTT